MSHLMSHRAPEPPDPNERLAQLNIELDQHMSRINHLTKQKDELQADINDLTQTVAEVKSTLSDYGSQIKTLETTLQGLQYFYDQKQKMVMAAIGDKKGPIDDLIREFDYETAGMKERLAELTDALAKATQESNQAGSTQTAKQAEYDKVKGYMTAVTANLTDLGTLRSSITQADSSTDIASMYFEVLEFQHELSDTGLISQHQLALELKQKLGELELAKEQARAKSAEMGRLQTEQTAQQTAVTNRISGRRQQLLTSIQTMFPPPAQTATATSTGAAAASAAVQKK